MQQSRTPSRFATKTRSPGRRSAATWDRYRVYQIYVAAKSVHNQTLFKYGITRQGPKRPRSQLKRCAVVMKVDMCTWRWLRTGPINGWLAARRIEAGYAARYKRDHGKCPPGMKRCL